MNSAIYVGVIGAGDCPHPVYETARRVGYRIGEKGWLTTGLGEGRNLLVVRGSDVLVAIAGGYGTLSEIGFALKTGKPVIGIHTWEKIEGIRYISDPDEVIPVIEEIRRVS